MGGKAAMVQEHDYPATSQRPGQQRLVLNITCSYCEQTRIVSSYLIQLKGVRAVSPPLMPASDSNDPSKRPQSIIGCGYVSMIFTQCPDPHAVHMPSRVLIHLPQQRKIASFETLSASMHTVNRGTVTSSSREVRGRRRR